MVAGLETVKRADKPGVWLRLDSGMVQRASNSCQAGAEEWNARDARRVDTEVPVGQPTLVGLAVAGSMVAGGCAPPDCNCCLSVAILAQGALYGTKNRASRRLPALTNFPQSARPCVIKRDGVIGTLVSYSYLKATMGSTRIARRAAT